MIRTVVALLALAAFGYLAACAALFFFQRSLIYFPQPRGYGSASDLMKLEVDGVQVLVSTRPHSGRRALIYFGGNAEDVSANLPELVRAFPDRAIYLMHYRGFGGSSGAPSEQALHRDALFLFDRVHAAQPDTLLIGRSLGTGVAVRVASQRPVTRLVLVTPYDSLQDLAAAQFPYFPVRWLMTDKFESSAYAPLVLAPTLLIAAERDDVIPRVSTMQLLERFPKGLASLKVLPGTGHNTISQSPLYLDLLRGPS